MKSSVILIALCSLAALPMAAISQPKSSSQSASQKGLSVGDPERMFKSTDLAGIYLAVHFIGRPDNPSDSRFVQEYTEKAHGIAGLHHIFVTNLSNEEFKKELGTIPDGDKLPVYRDVDGKLAFEYSITISALPTTVVLDPSGKELFRRQNMADKAVSFDSFAGKFNELTKTKETTEGNLDQRLALQGFDPVAYLDARKAAQGEKSLESKFRGTTYRFSTAANRDAFNANPTKYLPAYGGWCATAMAKGEKVEVDPQNFKITNGRLFLFYKGVWGNAINDWNKDEASLTSKADDFWKKRTAEK